MTPRLTKIGWKHQTGALTLAALALTLCFGRALVSLFRFSISSEMYSHIFLIPFVSLYLIWIERRRIPPFSRPDYPAGVLLGSAGAFVLGINWVGASAGKELSTEDSLCLTTLSFLLLSGGICALALGRRTLRSLAFPLTFLLLMVPYPTSFINVTETILEYGSAAVALALFRLTGTPVYSSSFIFQLPGIRLQVAPECSGIHSTLALFITSLVAGHLFLQSNFRRCLLTIAVLPLALLRNGFRIYTIGELCVYIGPEMINSYIHRHGGPLFFLFSLIPFFLFLRLLIKFNPVATGATQLSVEH